MAPLRSQADAERALRRFERAEPNFDPSRADGLTEAHGWRVDDYAVELPPEPPGPPEPGGSWTVACQVLTGYEFVDPRIVRAVYSDGRRLDDRRTMVLDTRFYGLQFLLGVRVSGVVDETAIVGGRAVRVWGWSYQTLRGHLERGQMDFEVRKWLDTGDVEFAIHAVSRAASIPNPVVRLGFALFGRMMQKTFLRRALSRMHAIVVERIDARGRAAGLTSR